LVSFCAANARVWFSPWRRDVYSTNWTFFHAGCTVLTYSLVFAIGLLLFSYYFAVLQKALADVP
jgi:hypothetical protein